MKNVRVNAIWPGELLENAGYSLVHNGRRADNVAIDVWPRIFSSSTEIPPFVAVAINAEAIEIADETD